MSGRVGSSRESRNNPCYHIRTLQCTEPYNSRNGHTVSNVSDSQGPSNPQIRGYYIGNYTLSKDTDSRNASGASRIAVGCLVGCPALVAELWGGAW